MPLRVPFILGIDAETSLIVRRHCPEYDRYLEKAYKMGSLLSTGLGQGSFGLRRADDALGFLTLACHKKLSEMSFLEIGCGDGYLLHRLALKGAAKVTGCEPGTSAIEGRKKFGINIINDFYRPELVERKYDMVFSYAVLEHVDDLKTFMAAQKKALKNDGRIFMAVPNCLRKLEIGDIGMLAYEHWNYFTEQSIRNVLAKSGFTDIGTALGRNQAMIYAWGTKTSGQEEGKTYCEKEFFFTFCSRAQNNLKMLKERIGFLQKKGKKLGLYGGGINVIAVINPSLEPRFFNGDSAQQGKYYPGFNNPIEKPDNLLKFPVDELWIMAIDYTDEIVDYLQNILGIPQDIEIVTFI